ncbi:hypothetical protein AJ80_02104 [Polytolypa hystricis UAMH7299]|uniref:Serine hydrolase domain-containing protein n=1 Tax=Polytolypa hystricis (strain UAMH7299) TaxID=1447883 RepID=A0A2B7YQA3_POLH7|nr:hypothetical protein AJ80_02104 [Polytolypa hystricis UAMH7299]
MDRRAESWHLTEAGSPLLKTTKAIFGQSLSGISNYAKILVIYGSAPPCSDLVRGFRDIISGAFIDVSPPFSPAALRYELGDHHEYDFVEGTVLWPAAPEIKHHLSSDDETFAYFEPSSPSSVFSALQDLEAYVEEEGPFDGILAFSHGATLAASFLIYKSQQRRTQKQLALGFKCAIFISGAPPVEFGGLREDGTTGSLHDLSDGELISVPTVHIWGRKDNSVASPLSDITALYSQRITCLHDGGHEVPGPETKKALTDSVKAIRRVIDMAIAMP